MDENSTKSENPEEYLMRKHYLFSPGFLFGQPTSKLRPVIKKLEYMV